MSLVVLKLGGSVITEKDRPETLDDEALDRAVDAITAAIADGDVQRLVIVHGGGSFGHHYASEFGVTTTDGTRSPDAVAAIHGAMERLNQSVLERLLERGVPAVPVHPFSSAYRDRDGALHVPTDQIATMVDEGFVPVLYGDLVVHAGTGATVVSGDELVAELARSLRADRIGLCSTVPGVLDADGSVVDRIESIDAVESILGESDATDVTGGMAGKVRTLLSLDAPASIFGPSDVDGFLRGSNPGTTVD